jgi:hypothetical protein
MTFDKTEFFKTLSVTSRMRCGILKACHVEDFLMETSKFVFQPHFSSKRF